MHNLEQFRLPRGFRGKSAVIVQLWWLADTIFFRSSPQVFYAWRRLILRAFGAKVGIGVRIRSSVRVTYPWKVEIGDYAWIGDDVTLYSLGHISIGSNAVVSQKAYLCAGGHRTDSPSFAIFSAPIKIHASAWVAADVFIGPGVTVGLGAVIGARSTVVTDVPPMVICFGNPARTHRARIMAEIPLVE